MSDRARPRQPHLLDFDASPMPTPLQALSGILLLFEHLSDDQLLSGIMLQFDRLCDDQLNDIAHGTEAAGFIAPALAAALLIARRAVEEAAI